MECQMRRYHKNSNGFTMAEMLITVAIIVILCGFGFVAVIAHQRNLKRMEMDETAQEIFIAAQNHLTAARASGQWSSFLEKTAAEGQDGSRGTAMSYDPSDYNRASDADAESRKFYYFTTESAEAVKNGAEALILPEGSIDETLRGHHFYVEYDAASGTVFGVFYTDSDHPITADDATAVSLSRTDPDARRDYKVDGKRTIIGYYGGALGELNSPGDLYAPSVAVRNAESLVLYVVDKNYYRPVSSKEGAQNFQTKLKLTFEGVTSGKKAVKEVDPSSPSSQTDAFSSAVLAEESEGTFNVVIPSSGVSAQQTTAVKAEYYAIVLDSIVRKDGHFADLFPEFIPGEDIRITATLTSDKAGEDVSQTVTVNSLFNSVKTEKNLSDIAASKTMVTVSNPRHLENLSSEVSGVDFAGKGKQIVKDTTVDTVSVVRNLFWDEDAEAEKGEAANEKVTAFIPAIASATGMKSEYGYNAGGSRDAAAITQENLQVYPYSASGTENAANSSGNSAPTSAGEGENLITKGSCYGITNTAIKSFEGNNHILAAFRFEGKQNAALINEAADGLTVSDLLIADVSAVVTGESADGSGAEETPAAAVLLAKAKSGSIENIAVRWYEGGTNQNVTLPAGSNVAAGMQGCRVYAEKGIASALIGSVDAKQAGSAAGSLEISNVSLCTMVKAASHDGKKVTAHLGIEGETTAVLLGEIKSGAVTLGNSKPTEEDRKSYVCIEGTLSLKSDKGQEDSQASGGLIGRISGGENALVKQLDFTASRMEMETKGGAAGGLAGVISGGQKAGLEEISLSANSLDVTGKTAAGGAVGNVSAGELSLNKINILTTKENKRDCGEAGQEANGTEKPYGIRVTAENGTAGGLLGAASSSVTKLTITEAAVSGSGTADQVKAGSSAGGLIGDTKASNTTIMSSAVSLYIRSEGNGGNVGGSSSTDGAGGLIGSASGNVTITSSYSGGRTTNASDPDEEKSDASAKQARYVNAEEGRGRYNVYLASGSGAAGGLLGKFNGTTGSLKIENSYSTSSVAIPYSSGSTGAAAGGLVGDAGTTTLTANNTYCTGRVYANGAQNGTSVGTATGGTTGSTSGSTAGTSTPNYGIYAGKLGGISGSGNYYLKGMNGIPSDAVGTLGGKTPDITIAENVLAGADYYDDNCALKKEVDTAQKSYYFDTALAATKYPFKTVTTVIARPVCDPDTGMRKQNAEDDTNRFAQIGDWEIPKEEASAEGAYGLIYYERIWDGTTNKLDPTFYYHGYMLESGEDAKSATYKEIHSKASFVTAKEHYVSESGYLLLIRKDEQPDQMSISIMQGAGANKGTVDGIWGQIQKKTGELSTYDFSSIAGMSVPGQLKDYVAYDVVLPVNEYDGKAWMFIPDNNNGFGILLKICKNSKVAAAYTYIPFFADALTPAEKGKVETVSKKESSASNDVQACIRSAEQMNDFFTFENGAGNTGFLGQNGKTEKFVVEQQLDITFDNRKVTFYKDGQQISDDAYQGAYHSVTLDKIGLENQTYRAKKRPEASTENDYYILDGLRAPLVTEVWGTLCDLQITNMEAQYFVEKIHYNENVFVRNVFITNAKFATKENPTQGGFAANLQGGSVENCHIYKAQIYGDGFVSTTETSNGKRPKISNCSIEDAVIYGNGFGTNFKITDIENCHIYKAQIYGDGFVSTTETDYQKKPKISNCSIEDAVIYRNGFGTNLKSTDIENCKIINSVISKNGFAEESMANIENTTIINAIIGQNGFVKKNAGSIRNCGIYADPFLYSKDTVSNYRPYGNSNGTYDYVSIGIAPGGTKSSENIAGFVQEQNGWGQSIRNCYVAGTVYGLNDVSGFIGNAGCGLTIENCYANVVLDAGGNANGFAREATSYQTKIVNCHALGIIRNANEASGAIRQLNEGSSVTGFYTAFWSVKAQQWYPFYCSLNSSGSFQNNYYLTDCSINTNSGVPNTTGYTAGQVDGKTYEELCALKIDGLQDQADDGKTAGYYQFMPNDVEHQTYPYPMPAGMIAYGDWSYYQIGTASLVYYEVVDGKYYLHGVTTGADGTGYLPVQNTLLHEAGETVTEDGYLLILKNTGGNDGEYSIRFSNVNGGNASEQYTVGTANAPKSFVQANDTLTKAMKNALGIKQDCTVYRFDPNNYLTLNTEGFSALDTYAQYSGGVGLTVTQGSNLMAKFSFLPIFADTVTAPTVQNVNGKTEISFASVQKDAAQDGADYIIRSARQLKLLSDWDGKKLGDSESWNNFDKDLAKRYSYLSSTNTGYKNHLVIRQDMDLQAPDTSGILFENVDGTYKGQTYTVTGESTAEPVKLSGLQVDFAGKIAPSGTISSLIIEGARYELDSEDQGRTDVISASNDLTSKGNGNEFVRYNCGTISDVIIQNSDLGTGGLVYQNEYVKPSESAGDDYRSGVIQNCVIRNSEVKGAGLAWKNLGGRITNSSVENCKTGFAGFVQKNVSQDLEKDASGNAVYAKAVVDSCTVRNIVAAGNGFAGNNTGVEPMAPFSSTEESCRAEIRNCSVVNGVISGYGFAYENEENGFIENCQIYGDKSQYEEYLTEAATWTGEQVNRRYYPYTDRTEQKKKAYELVTLTVRTDNFSGAGFAGKNDEKSGITNCSVTGVIDWENKKPLAGFIDDNKGNITGSCNNVIMGSRDNNADGKASGFVNDNEGSISFCHTLGTIEGNSSIAGFSMDNKEGNISCSYSAMWSYKAKKYSLFAPANAGGTFTSCYALLLDSNGTEASGITKVTAEMLKKKTELSGVTAGTAVKTVAYGQLNTSLNEKSEYPFPCGSSITNYGDWQENVTASGNEKTVTLLAGSNAAFAGEAIPALMSEEIADEDILQEEGPREIQAVLGEDETELNLSEFVPQMKGWKLLGWLITSPSELSASEKTTTVSDVVTKINKLSDGDAEASGSSKAVYELETGTKSYHYAPDAVITVTEDMTLSAVWVPDDDTIEKAKDGTLRMDENGNILEDKNEAESTGTTETSEAGTTESSTAGTTETPEEGTTEPSTAGTTETPEEGTTESAITGTTESPEEGTTESSTTGTTEMSETESTESTELSSSGTETSAENGGGTCDEIYQAEY